jgi:hypothetical protein
MAQLRAPKTKASRLQICISASSWWLMGQGVLYVVLGDWMSQHLALRYSDGMAPFVRLAAMALFCLGLFINRAVRQASRQYLAVDTLVLFFLGCSIFTLTYRVEGNTVQWFEWLSLAVNLGLGTALAVYRTKGSEMPSGSLVTMDILDALSQVGIGKGSQRPLEPALSPLEAFPDEAPPKTPKGKSEAQPRMD